MGIDLLDASQRPALAAHRPLLWRCEIADRRDRASARALLRGLLAHYLGTDAAALPLRHLPGRAPELAARWQGVELGIGVSYAVGVALIGICPGARIGVDVARIAPMPDWREVARLYLGPSAGRRLARASDRDRDALFASEWAAMEAKTKCLGLALGEWTPQRAGALDAVRAGCSQQDGCAFAFALALA